MTDLDWSDDDVARFVAEQLNHYGMDCVTPEQSKQGISTWKRWLWLEKHGFDFAYESLEREIFAFRLNQSRSQYGVPLESERRLLRSVRGVMREILSLPPLNAEAKASLMSAIPISNWTHWAHVPLPTSSDRANEDADYSYVINFIWDFMRHDKPEYIKILGDIRSLDETNPEEFVDNYTINGAYELSLGPNQKRLLYHTVTGYHFTRAYDMFFSPGNRKLINLVGSRFTESIDVNIG